MKNGSTVTLSFSEIIAAKPADLQVALYISKDDGASEENVDVTWMNDKTVFFKAPGKYIDRFVLRFCPHFSCSKYARKSLLDLFAQISGCY